MTFILLFSSLSILYGLYRNLGPSVSLRQGAEAVDLAKAEKAREINRRLSLYDEYIRKNIGLIAPDDSSDLVIDDVCFIGENRALIFYRDQEKRLISEVVMDLKVDGAVEISKVFLKVSGDQDYSQGVYGADPG